VTDALFQPETRAAFRRLAALGLTDAVRAVEDAGNVYTFWDYQAGAWQKNHGIRIDHLMLSPEAADRLVQAGVDRHTRAWEKPSDHVPVWVELS
jgi:exodeoxyribonuclease-3